MLYLLYLIVCLIRKTPPSNHITPLPAGEGLGVGLFILYIL